MPPRRTRPVFVCGSPDDCCGDIRGRIADEHSWPKRTRMASVRPHGEGPPCEVCGLPLGTWQREALSGGWRGMEYGIREHGTDRVVVGPDWESEAEVIYSAHGHATPSLAAWGSLVCRESPEHPWVLVVRPQGLTS